MKRKWLSALLSGALAAALTAAPVSAASVFTGETVDEWAVERVESAIRLELMPECLEGQDLRAEMTRAEFAALTVKLYEAMSGKLAEVPKQNPFRDTQDPEVLKAYGLGFVTGLTEDTFGGEEPVTREQAAVMLTAVYQYRNEDNRKAFLLWVALYGRDNDLNDDSNLTEQQASNMLAGIYHKLDTVISSVGAKEFADDGEISDWAKNSVYFMEKNGIITGVGGDPVRSPGGYPGPGRPGHVGPDAPKAGVSGTPRKKAAKREALGASLFAPAGQWSGGPAKRFTGPGTGSHASRRRIPPGPDRGQTAAPPSGNRPESPGQYRS